MADHLRDCGFHVLEAGNGPLAVELLQSTGVDAVFTDVMMPGQPDGLGLAQWICANVPRVPVLITSADAGVAAAVRSHWPFIAKPYDPAQVVQRLHDLLQRPA